MGRPKKITPVVEKAPPRLPGTVDLLPEQHATYQMFCDRLHNLASTFSYWKIDTPAVEDPRLFKFWLAAHPQASLVEGTAGPHRLAFKPTNLFSVARAYLEHNYYEKERTTKWFYHSPILHQVENQLQFRHEWGFQIFGDTSPIADVQLINLVRKLFRDAKPEQLRLEINNIGCLECLPVYTEVLKNFFKDKRYDLCEECLEHLEGRTVNILACRNLSCSATASEAPVLMDYLCEPCRRHFIAVLEGLDELDLVYNLNPKIVGLPWSRKTVFELRYQLADQQELVLGSGGHADDLVQSIGGPAVSALGFTGWLETAIPVLEQANPYPLLVKSRVEVFLVPLGELAAKKSLRLFTDLWSHDIAASEFVGAGPIKTQLKLAESNKVSIALIIGQKEARDGTVILRDIPSGMQELFTSERIVEEVKKRLGK